MFRNLHLNQLGTYFTADENTKQFLVRIIMFKLQLPPENVLSPPTAEKKLTSTSALNKLTLSFTAKQDHNAWSNHKKSYEHTKKIFVLPQT